MIDPNRQHMIPLCDAEVGHGWRCCRIAGHKGGCILTPRERRAPFFKRLACTMFGGHTYETKHLPGSGSALRFSCTKCHDERLV